MGVKGVPSLMSFLPGSCAAYVGSTSPEIGAFKIVKAEAMAPKMSILDYRTAKIEAKRHGGTETKPLSMQTKDEYRRL